MRLMPYHRATLIVDATANRSSSRSSSGGWSGERRTMTAAIDTHHARTHARRRRRRRGADCTVPRNTRHVINVIDNIITVIITITAALKVIRLRNTSPAVQSLPKSGQSRRWVNKKTCILYYRETDKRHQFSFVCISFGEFFHIQARTFIYIKKRISYNSVHLILTRIKNFA